MLLGLLNGQLTIPIAIMIIIAIIIALTFHEFGHAFTAKLFGDNTAEKAGRLSLNPLVHIDPMGLLMVAMVGFGYAKPVPTNPRNFRNKLASPTIAFAGPAMNLILATIGMNLFAYGRLNGIESIAGEGQAIFFEYFVTINLLLFLFNLLPIGALDGHYIAEYVLRSPYNYKYYQWNSQYGNLLLMGLIVASIVGVPIFSVLWRMAYKITPFINFVT